MYHYDGGVVDPKTWQLDALGQDLKKTHAKFVSVHPELMKLKQPSAIWSTPITVVAAHFHFGAVGVSGPIVRPITPAGGVVLPKDIDQVSLGRGNKFAKKVEGKRVVQL
jgi:hypothetical protein